MNRAELASLLERYRTTTAELRKAVEAIAREADRVGEANHAGMMRMELSRGHLAFAAEHALEYLDECERYQAMLENLS